MKKPFVSMCAVVALGLAAVTLAGPKFIAVWKSPDVARLNFAGKKVAALAITDDQPLQMSAEEALTRELTARGVNGIAAYRLLPREEMKDADKAKGWFERAAIDGVVALRPVRKDTEKVYTPTVWASVVLPELLGLLRLRLEQRLRRRFIHRNDDHHRGDPDLQRSQRRTDLGGDERDERSQTAAILHQGPRERSGQRDEEDEDGRLAIRTGAP